MARHTPTRIQGEDMMVVYTIAHLTEGGAILELGNAKSPKNVTVTAAEGLDILDDRK
jgi:hypothetical protein